MAVLLTVLAAACAPDSSDGGAAATTTTTERATSTTVAADGAEGEERGAGTTTVAGPEGTVAPAPPQEATPSCPTVPARAEPRADRSVYRLDLDVRPDENAVYGTQSVRFTPDLDTDVLVFRLWANGPRPASAGARIDVELADSDQPDPTTLITARDLKAGQTTEVSLTWKLTLPGPVNDRMSRTGDAIRLGSFFPILAWEPGVGWARQPPTSGFAEASVAPIADFSVGVTVPDDLDVLATGVRGPDGRWEATAVGDFALSIGRFTTARREVDGIEVVVGVHAGIEESPEPYADKVARVLADFAARYGPYPWPSYTLAVTPHLSGGIEYPMHVLQGPGNIGRTTSHEVAHMWFYGLVVNDQGRDPWIDEGIATWAEGRFEGTTASLMATTIPSGGRNRVGQPMSYWETRQSIYYRSVYVQGAQAIGALGEPDRVDCALRHLVARHAYDVAGSGDLIDALTVVFPDAESVLARYGIHRPS